MPSAYGSIRIDFGRSWSVSSDYRRSLTVLEGITPSSYVTHTALVSAGGFIGSRLENVWSIGYSNGQTGGAEAVTNPGKYDSYTGAAQLRLGLSRWWSALVSFNRNQYTLYGSAQRVGLASRLHRNAVRVGFSWTLPLYGAYTAGSGGSETR
jgi:hypothetical protein